MVPYGNTSRDRGRGKRKNKGKDKKKKQKPRRRRIRTSKVVTKEQELRFVADLEKRSGKPISEWFEILKKFDPQKKLLQEELGSHLAGNYRVGKWDGKLIAFYYQHPERLETPVEVESPASDSDKAACAAQPPDTNK
jgi:hypothetical protein